MKPKNYTKKVDNPSQDYICPKAPYIANALQLSLVEVNAGPMQAYFTLHAKLCYI